MKILHTKVLNGPNYWSNKRKKLIEIKLDLEKYEYLPSNKIQNFVPKLKKLMPSLYSHRCSEGVEGGFFFRLDDGTWLGHIIEHIALELQTLAGMQAGFGRTFGTNELGVYHVIFAFEIEQAGLYAGLAAIELVECLARGENYKKLSQNIQHLKNLYETHRFGPSTEALVNEAMARQIPFARFKDTSLIILGHGVKQKKIWATVSSDTSAIGVDMVANKELTKQILSENFIPVPRGLVVRTLNELKNAIKELKYPLVIKPYNGNHGRGITCNISDETKAISSFKFAKTIAKKVIIEQFIQGCDYRFLVMNYKVVAVAKRTPAKVIGDGKSTISQLINIVNLDPLRGKSHENYLTSIKIDQATLEILNENHLTLDSILPKNKVLYLKYTANLSSGGSAENVMDLVHSTNIKMAERVARIVNLDICGLDVVCKDITKVLTHDNGAIIEVNAGPGFRMHLSPSDGKKENVASILMDSLFKNPKDSRIPIVAVTGTNAKTTVVRFIAYLAKRAGKNVGFTTTDGIYVNDELIYNGDCSGPRSASVILQEPLVDYAVLECARGGILRSGLAFDNCDISIITNVTPDHLGISDIHTVEELTEVKAVVARSTHIDGYAILNAEDDLVYGIKKDLKCNIALFGLQENSRIKEHCEKGGIAAFTKNQQLIIKCANHIEILGDLAAIPITFNGEAKFMIQNLLPVVLAGYISNFSLQDIKEGIQNFVPSAYHTPGRMNLFNFGNFKVMVDYAHNEGAYLEIGKYLESIDCAKKIGIIGVPGDRRPEDIKKLGFHSAKMFDEIIIRHNIDGRGKSNQQLTDLILEGINDCNTDINVKVISDECDAIKHAMGEALPDTFIFYAVDNVDAAINLMHQEISLLSE